MIELSALTRVRAIVSEAGLMTQEASFYFQQLELLQPISGNGSPEGVIDAQASRTYYDLTGGTGSIIYIKTVDDIAGDRTLGWVIA